VTPILKVSRAENGDTIELALDGELDLASVSNLESALFEALACRPACVVVDAARLSYMDSSGISCLMRAANEARSTGARVVVRNADGVVANVMSITGVDAELIEP
jgi:anti-sigma B factor antagonist